MTSGQTYRTQPLASDIQTIQVNANGDWLQLPIIELNSDDYLQISFDRLSRTASNRLRYKIIHCNADWTQSSLSTIEYIDGFDDNLIDDFSESTNTAIEYTNFRLELPNRDVSFKVSGNYVLLVNEEDNPDNVLLSACFSVLDPQVGIVGKMSSNTDIDSNKEHQQINFEIDYAGLTVRDAFTDLKVFVSQNNRLDNQKKFIKPTSVRQNKLVFEHNRDLIFEAGNEYRRFETVSYRYNGLNVGKVEFKNPIYQAHLVPQKITEGKVYSYDEDKNGRFFIRNAEGTDSDIDADYFMTNFYLLSEDPILGNVYLNGEFTNNTFSDKYLMKYDANEGMYYTSLLLKQGAYNYQYLTKIGNKFTPSKTEGNYFETENEYLITVYHRPMGQRFDSFIGLLQIKKR